MLFLGNNNCSAQKGITLWRNYNDTNFLCKEIIHCYNDSIAFWDAGCEDHSHSISILKYRLNGDTIRLKTIKDGFNMLLRKVIKRKGDPMHPKFTIVGLGGYNETPGLLHVLPKKRYWLVRDEYELKVTDHDSITTKDIKQLKKGPVIPDNLFPLLFDELKTHFGSLYHDITAYVYLPSLCLTRAESKYWVNLDLSFVRKTDSTAYEPNMDYKWHRDYPSNYRVKRNSFYKKKE